MPSTRVALIKTDAPNLYKPPKRLVVLKASFQHFVRSKLASSELLQSSYTLCGSQNALPTSTSLQHAFR